MSLEPLREDQALAVVVDATGFALDAALHLLCYLFSIKKAETKLKSGFLA